jgi:hypothetical protein
MPTITLTLPDLPETDGAQWKYKNELPRAPRQGEYFMFPERERFDAALAAGVCGPGGYFLNPAPKAAIEIGWWEDYNESFGLVWIVEEDSEWMGEWERQTPVEEASGASVQIYRHPETGWTIWQRVSPNLASWVLLEDTEGVCQHRCEDSVREAMK